MNDLTPEQKAEMIAHFTAMLDKPNFEILVYRPAKEIEPDEHGWKRYKPGDTTYWCFALGPVDEHTRKTLEYLLLKDQVGP